jgi:hypothetical protein
MPDIHGLKEMLNQDVQLPFMLGMVARARTLVIDKPIITLMVLLLTTSITGGVAMYRLGEAEKTISRLIDKVEILTLSNNSLVAKVEYLTDSFDRHLTGHPVAIVK